MSLPSHEALSAAFGADKAKAIRAILEDNAKNKLGRIDAILGTHGVENIPPGHNLNSPSILYCNAGDPYVTTILKVNGLYVVGNWGAYIDRGNYD